jgi:hypothetical protein
LSAPIFLPLNGRKRGNIMMSLYLVIYLQNGKEKMQKVLACDRDRAKEKFCQKMDSAGISYTISQIMPIDTGIWC